jgi:hypothetical protein
MTLSPGLYILSDSLRSSSVLNLVGFAVENMSSKVETVALCFVPLTDARQAGHVYGCKLVARDAWERNHSFKQEPQKVCRQSRRVRGWYKMSVQIWSKSDVVFFLDGPSIGWVILTEQVNSRSRSI